MIYPKGLSFMALRKENEMERMWLGSQGGWAQVLSLPLKAAWPWNTTNLSLSCLIYKAAVMILTLQGCFKGQRCITSNAWHNKYSKVQEIFIERVHGSYNIRQLWLAPKLEPEHRKKYSVKLLEAGSACPRDAYLGLTLFYLTLVL